MRLTIARKLLAHSLLLITLVGVVASVGVYGLQKSKQDADKVVLSNQQMIRARELETDLTHITAMVLGYIITLDPQHVEAFREAAQEIEASLTYLEETAVGEEASTLVADVKVAYSRLHRQADFIVTMSEIRPEYLQQVVDTLNTPRIEANAAVGAFIDFQARRVEEIQSSAKEAMLLAEGVLATAAVVAIVTGLLISRAMSVSISRPVVALSQAAQRLAMGDLRVDELTVKARDEIGDMAASFNRMVRNLRRLLEGVTNQTQALLNSSQELTGASEQSAQAAQEAAQSMGAVAGGTSEQAASAQEVNRSIVELRQTIQQIASGASRSSLEVQHAAELLTRAVEALGQMADNTGSVADGAGGAAAAARAGAQVVGQTVEGMERIKAVVGESAARIHELEQSSAQIGEITVTISAIADQTNLLALNAAIEAARAGEHGRGFAVVAEEVRKLAERSASSAREISGLIASIQTQTAEVVGSMAKATEEVETGSRLANEAGQRLDEILTMAGKAAADVQQVAQTAHEVKQDAQRAVTAFSALADVTEENTAATEEMAGGTDEMTRTIASISHVSQQNAAAAEEVSASIEELTAASEQVASLAQDLTGIARELENQVSIFKL